MEAILASMVEGVLVVDEQGRLQLVNDAARRILKLEKGAIDNPYVEAIRHPGIVEHIGRALKGEETEGLELSVTRDTTRTLVARVAPVVTAGRGAVLVLHDITELRKADLVRRDFVANVSHELRTPLTAIKGYAEALLDDPEDADAREKFLDIIHRHATRMERLVKDLLRLARLDAGQETVELVPCDVEGLLRGIANDFEPMAAQKQQTIDVRVAPGAATIATDAAKLHDIARNLIENAVNYTPDGGAIDVGAAIKDGRFQLTVADTGHGIAPDDLGAGVRTVLSSGQIADQTRRHRTWPVDRQAPGSGPRRRRHRLEPVRRRRRFHGHAADAMTRAALADQHRSASSISTPPKPAAASPQAACLRSPQASRRTQSRDQINAAARISTLPFDVRHHREDADRRNQHRKRGAFCAVLRKVKQEDQRGDDDDAAADADEPAQRAGEESEHDESNDLVHGVMVSRRSGGLHLYLHPELDDALGREPEVRGRADRVARHQHEQFFAPQRHAVVALD